MDLLWENASPTSKFSGQFVGFKKSLNDGDFVEIELIRDPSDVYNICNIKAKVGESGIATMPFRANDNRRFTVSNTGVQFQNAIYYQNYCGSAETASDGLVPIRIWHLKGVPA